MSNTTQHNAAQRNVLGLNTYYIQPKRGAYFVGRRASLDCFLFLPVGIDCIETRRNHLSIMELMVLPFVNSPSLSLVLLSFNPYPPSPGPRSQAGIWYVQLSTQPLATPIDTPPCKPGSIILLVVPAFYLVCSGKEVWPDLIAPMPLPFFFFFLILYA